MSNISTTVSCCKANWQRKNETDEIISIIRENVSEGSYIAVTDPYSCEFYIETECESSSYYPYIQREGMYDTDEFWPSYIAELRENIPEAIIWYRVKDAEKTLGSFLQNYELVYRGVEEEIYMRKNKTMKY